MHENKSAENELSISVFSLLFGVATADALGFFNEKQLQFGISLQTRNQILSTLVSEGYPVHQREIFSGIQCI